MKNVTLCDLCERVIGDTQDARDPSITLSVGKAPNCRLLDICADCGGRIEKARITAIERQAPKEMAR